MAIEGGGGSRLELISRGPKKSQRAYEGFVKEACRDLIMLGRGTCETEI